MYNIYIYIRKYIYKYINIYYIIYIYIIYNIYTYIHTCICITAQADTHAYHVFNIHHTQSSQCLLARASAVRAAHEQSSLRGTTSIACEVLLRKLDPTLGAIVGPCRNSWGRKLDPTLGAIANGDNACSKEGLLHDRRCPCLLSKESISHCPWPCRARGLATALGHFLPQDDCIICNTPPCPNIVNLHIAMDDLSYPNLGPCLEKAMARFHGPRGHQQLHVLHEPFERLLVLLRSHTAVTLDD